MASQPEHREAAFKTPTLSVLICTRNRPEKLKRAVDSVLSNSFTDFELIVVDQSTDEKSKELLATLDDRRLQYIPTNTIGLSISRNIALRCSRADSRIRGKLGIDRAQPLAIADAVVIGIGDTPQPCGGYRIQLPRFVEPLQGCLLPGPLVQHDKWMNGLQFADLMKGAVRGLALVFLSYTLRLDRFAFDQLLRIGYRVARNRMAIGSVSVGLWYFAEGLALGPIYRMKRPSRFVGSRTPRYPMPIERKT